MFKYLLLNQCIISRFHLGNLYKRVKNVLMPLLFLIFPFLAVFAVKCAGFLKYRDEKDHKK